MSKNAKVGDKVRALINYGWIKKGSINTVMHVRSVTSMAVQDPGGKDGDTLLLTHGEWELVEDTRPFEYTYKLGDKVRVANSHLGGVICGEIIGIDNTSNTNYTNFSYRVRCPGVELWCTSGQLRPTEGDELVEDEEPILCGKMYDYASYSMVELQINGNHLTADNHRAGRLLSPLVPPVAKQAECNHKYTLMLNEYSCDYCKKVRPM